MHDSRVLSLRREPQQEQKPQHLKIGVTLSGPRTFTEEELQNKPKRAKYSSKYLEEKRQEALQILGKHWRMHPETEFCHRGEFFLTVWSKEIAQRRPPVTIASGTTMLGIDLKRLINEVVKDDQRVYVGELKVYYQ